MGSAWGVGEHLAALAAPAYVNSLVGLAPVIVFSAAIPGQPGTHYVNCQWPGYWVALFAAYSFRAIDCLRIRFWDHPDVAPFYKQNMLLFVAASAVANHPRLPSITLDAQQHFPALVHPAYYNKYPDFYMRSTVRWHLRSLLPALERSVHWRASQRFVSRRGIR